MEIEQSLIAGLAVTGLVVFWRLGMRLIAALEEAHRTLAVKQLADQDPTTGRIWAGSLAKEVQEARDVWRGSPSEMEATPAPPIPPPSERWETLGFLGDEPPMPSVPDPTQRPPTATAPTPETVTAPLHG